MAEGTFYFPKDFKWGTATAAHQVEGGNGNNNWWAFEQEEDRIFEGHTSGDACQWWNGKALEDVQRMAELNTNAHRLSIEWSRIEPSPGDWNHEAIEQYRSILKAMKEAGIEPMITLHHFTNPLWVEEKGGWLNDETPAWFQRFVRRAILDLVDLCDLWCTINEPNVYAAQGYYNGVFPPARQNIGQYFQVLHNMLLGHARAYRTIHDVQAHARVGLAKHMVFWQPLRKNPMDKLITQLLENAFNRLTLDTLATGQWKPLIGKNMQLDHVAGTLDWIGLNYYQRYDASFRLNALSSLGTRFEARPDAPKGPGDWGEIYPDGMFTLLKHLYRQFNLPIYITENGVPDEFDNRRSAFIVTHLRRVWSAINYNIPVVGYYFWSLIDNFEWAQGYDPQFRFGLYKVDFKTQERSLRRSGELYSRIAEQGAISYEMVKEFAPVLLPSLFPGDKPNSITF